jgi:hypothetical protein
LTKQALSKRRGPGIDDQATRSRRHFPGLQPDGQEFVIGGYVPSHLGVDSIVIGFYRDKQLRYSARVNSSDCVMTKTRAKL